jgi:hypothetical protein
MLIPMAVGRPARLNVADVEHLLSIIRRHYAKVSVDWNAPQYCGMQLDWDYENRTVNISMPGYVERALYRFAHPPSDRPEDSPYEWKRPQYGVKIQMADTADTSPKLDASGTKHVQEVIGVFLFYARAIDNTMLAALGTLAALQANATT